MTRNVLSPDLTVRDLNDWAKMQVERLRRALGSEKSSQPAFVLAQAGKLAEEVGELQAEILGLAGYQRATKDQCFTAESLSRELADVMICVATLASSYDIDLGKALASKIKTVDAHYGSQLRTQ
jgi:NTP pyrophosphatase (non-canonical NTP hydrolase)